jgi:amphi-Trp domain-containing protein
MVFSLEEFVDELRRLADTLEAGEPFEIEVGGEMVTVPADAVISIEYEREESEEELEFQLKWQVEMPEAELAGEEEDMELEDEEGEDEEMEDESDEVMEMEPKADTEAVAEEVVAEMDSEEPKEA